VADQHHRRPELAALDDQVLDIVEVIGEVLDVTPPAAALTMAPAVEGQDVEPALGQVPPDMLVAPGVLGDPVHEEHRRLRGRPALRHPASLVIDQVPAALQL
jgi:hypothetical protein